MATEIQYNVFRSLYVEEAERYTNLASRAQIYFSIISLYLGAIAFKFEDVEKFIKEFKVPAPLFLSLGGVLVLSLLATIASVAIRNYEGASDPLEIINEFGDVAPSDADFLDDRLVDLAVATNRNSIQNNRTAMLLQMSVALLFLGAVLHLCVFCVAFLR